MDFRNRADCGTRIVGRGFLLNGNGWRQAFNQIHIGFIHHLQKLTRVGGQAFHITALPFGVQRIKRQRRFAAA